MISYQLVQKGLRKGITAFVLHGTQCFIVFLKGSKSRDNHLKFFRAGGKGLRRNSLLF